MAFRWFSIPVLLLLLCFVKPCRAQYIDSLHDVFQHKYNIDARIEARNSFINGQLISVYGVRLGVAFQRKLRIGGGISFLKSNVKTNFYTRNDLGVPDTVTKFLKFVYLSYYIDFVFYKTKRWQLSVPIQAGVGMSWFQNPPSYDLGDKNPKYLLLLYEPGITVQFKIFKWLGLGSDIAYRFTLKNNKKVGENLNSPTYSFKLLFWLNQAFYDLFPKSKITKRFGPAYW